MLKRAQGCLLGQLAGDALGSLVEFQSPEEIRKAYPHGVRQMGDGGTWDNIAGQPTDDSEMALLLARMLVKNNSYDPELALREYKYWLNSDPFDCGNTIASALRGHPNPQSQANGAMMRIAPLAIFGANYDLKKVSRWAQQDAALTHPNPICLQGNSLFAMAIAYAIKNGVEGRDLYDKILEWALDMEVDSLLLETIKKASTSLPSDYVHHQGWVVIAFQNALYQLVHAPNLEEGIVDTIMHGGDTDTNAAICGALLGSVHGCESVPNQWIHSLEHCRPEAGDSRVHNPRPECFWPVDVLELSKELISV